MQHKNKALDYFKRHPYSKECHITSDGRVFHSIGTAQGFAGTLKNRKIESYQVDTLLKEVEKEKEIQDATGKVEDVVTKEDVKEIEKATNEVEDAKKSLINTNVEDIEYNEMKGLVKLFNLESENQKKETLVKVLSEFKNTLIQD